jgi:hypothetical protein
VGEGPSRIVIRFVVGAPGRRHGSLRPQGLASAREGCLLQPRPRGQRAAGASRLQGRRARSRARALP